ncbi:MAG: tetratricopeptide repeat protein, partial [Myxococcales bacterium]|nr:tetratricopeptide repeat protein [Myxococcales bacterium]
MAFAVLQGKVDEPPPGSRVSTRLRRILIRGLSVEPEDRYPSMAELLAELSVDPWARRRRWLLGAGLALTLGLGGLAYVESRAATGELCADSDEAFAEVWDDDRKLTIKRAFVDTGRSFADDTWARVEGMLDDYTGAWVAMSRSACEATHVHHEQTPELLHLRMACLARRQSQVRALTDVFATADAGAVDKAISLVASLSRVDGCADADALVSEVLPPEDARTRAEVDRLEQRLDDARVQLGAGHYSEGLELASAVAEQARPLAYSPLVGQAELIRGQLLTELGDAAAAATALEAAVTEASRGKHARGAAEAWIELIDVIGVQQARFEEALAMRIAAEAALAWAGDGAQSRALSARLARVSGELLRMQGTLPEAESEARRAVAIIESLAESGARVNTTLADTLAGLGRLLRTRGEYDEATAVYRRALALREETLGTGHPDVASALTGLGNTAWAAGRYEDGRAYLERALAIRVAALGRGHVKVATTENSLGAVYQAEGRYGEAEEHFRKALAIREAELGPDHPQVAATRMNIGNALIQRGDLEGA